MPFTRTIRAGAAALVLALPFAAVAEEAALGAASAPAPAPSSAASAALRKSPARLKPSQCPMLGAVTGSLGRKEFGHIVMNVHTDEKGQVLDAALVSFETRESTAKDAVEGIKDCAFEPARLGAMPVESTMKLKLAFGRFPDRPIGLPGPNGSLCPRVFSPRLSDIVSEPTRMLLHFLPDGTVGSVDLVKTSGEPNADEAGLRTAKSCVADPAALAAKGQAFLADAPMTIDWTN